MKMNRRALIGGATLAAAVASIGGAAIAVTPDTSEWDAALANYRAAKDDYDIYMTEVVNPLAAEYEALPARDRNHPIFPAEAHSNELHSAAYVAMERLLRTPAPTLAALAVKLEIHLAEDVEDDEIAALTIAAMLDDVRRFDGAA